MGNRLYIPDQVKNAISGHVTTAVAHAIDGFSSAEEDEDALTGHLGALLRTGQHTVEVSNDEINGPWKWSVNYYKFRGRGKGASETLIGADGIFEIKLERAFQTDQKSLLFQAKKNWRNDSTLFAQALKLSTWREAALILNFTSTAFETYGLDDVVRSRGTWTAQMVASPLDVTIGREFPDCKVGDTDLRYDAVSKKLFWRDFKGKIVVTDFTVRHRLQVNVSAPRRDTKLKADKELDRAEVHLHRMRVSDESILSVQSNAELCEIKNAHRSAALAYHPDKIEDPLLKEIAGRRMQEANNAKDALLRKKRKHGG
jgi:hypothetical protein